VSSGLRATTGTVHGWPEVRPRVSQVAGAPGRLLIVSDFDGTLAPIVPDPAGARMDPLARRALRRLTAVAAGRPDRLQVVVLSGRAALDVASRVRVGGLSYLGNHGLERGSLARRMRAERLAVELEPGMAQHAGTARALGLAVAASLGHPAWLYVEDKGPSVAFHFRQAADADVARERVLAAIADAQTTAGEHGLATLEGRRVVELAPAGSGGKGAAVERLISVERATTAIVLGDDVSDAAAFEAVRGARGDGRLADGVTIAVHGAAETPARVMEAADLVLGSPRDAARVLSLVARILEREDAAEAS
jgi:trehalose 6-phosphate phosphatase